MFRMPCADTNYKIRFWKQPSPDPRPSSRFNINVSSWLCHFFHGGFLLAENYLIPYLASSSRYSGEYLLLRGSFPTSSCIFMNPSIICSGRGGQPGT